MTQQEDDVLGDALRASLGLLRVGVGVYGRIASAGVRTGADLTLRVASAAREGTPPQRIVEDAVELLRRQGRELLGVPAQEPAPVRPAPEPRRVRRPADPASLRLRGEQLLRDSVDVDYREEVHPAYAAILDVLAPDEARLLRHLALSGPEPAVDVRSVAVTGTSELLASGITLIGDQAGVRFGERVNGYLSNLHRLGLVWFAREPLPADRYEMLEAQPPVQQARRAEKRTRTVRRRIELTPFGDDFVRTCFPLEDA